MGIEERNLKNKEIENKVSHIGKPRYSFVKHPCVICLFIKPSQI